MRSFIKLALTACLVLGFGSTAAFAQINVEKLLASDGEAGDSFGVSVSLSGDRVLVGAFLDDDKGADAGAAYVFVRTGSGWALESKLVPADGEAGDYFGYSVSLSQVGTVSYAVVGAYLDDDKGTDAGAVYVFTHSGTNWYQQAKLTAADGASGDLFGVSVSVSSTSTDYSHLVVGAYTDDDKGSDAGSAYVFHRTNSTWAQQAKLTASDGASGDLFGVSVSISSVNTNTAYAVVGARGDDHLGSDSGSAYAYFGSGATWTEQTKLQAADGGPVDWFGASVSLSGSRALVGAHRKDDNGTDSGAAYVFVRSGTTWSQETKLVASDVGTFDSFGFSVSLSGSRALVGAYRDDDNGGDAGAAYVFALSGAGWVEGTKLVADDGAWSDHFGSAVSLDGNNAFVGAAGDDDAGSGSGSSYVLTLPTDFTPPTVAITLPTDGAVITENSVTVSGTVSDAGTGVSSVVVNGNAATVQTGTFSIVLSPLAEGPLEISATATDGATNQATASVNVTVNLSHPPVLAAIGDQTVDAGQVKSVNLSANDPDGPTSSFTLDGGPGFISVQDTGPGSATLTLDPGPWDASTYSVTVSVSDGSESDSETFSVTVNHVDMLAAHYPAEGSAVDATSNGFDGTLLDNAGFAQGVDGQAFSFDGSGDAVSLSGQFGGTREATITAWINTAGSTGDFQAIVSSTLDGGFVHFQAHSRPNIGISTDAGPVLLPVVPTSPFNVWRHVALRIASGDTRLYVDGALLGTNGQTFNEIIATSDLHIGAGHLLGRFFNGLIDEVRIYNYALSDAEIQAMSNDPPVLNAIGDQTVDAGQVQTVNLSANDPDGPTSSFTLDSGPGFISVQDTGPGSATLTLAPGPWDAGTYSVTVSVSDGSESDSETFSVTVNHVNLLAAHYPAEGSAVDVTSNGFDGSLLDNAGFAQGIEGQAFSFDGSGDAVSLSGQFGGTPEATITAWINTAGSTGDMQAIVSTTVIGEFVHFQAHSSPNIGVYTDAGVVLLPVVPTSPFNVWRHVALRIASGDTRVYVDGAVLGINSQTFNEIAATSELYIGAGFQLGRFFNGLMDEVRIYNHALSDAEIQALATPPNVAPVANAGTYEPFECTGPTGASVTLDGTGSHDPNLGQTLTYAWSASGITFQNGGTASPTATFPLGTTTVTLTVTDPFGESDMDQVDIVVQDKTPPAITLTGANPQILECGVAYTELGATALDACDGDVTGKIVIDASAVNASKVGSYSVTYNVSDAAGNAAVQVIRTVEVKDNTPPVITLKGANPQVLECGIEAYTELGATASDVCDGDVSASVVIDASAVNADKIGSYTVTYNVSDAAGNAAARVTRTVEVKDTTAPEIADLKADGVLIEDMVVTVECSEPGKGEVTLSATIGDVCDPDPEIKWEVDGNIIGMDASVIALFPTGATPTTVTLTVTDEAGNSASETLQVSVVDTTPPEITLAGEDPIFVELGTPYTEPGATASDICDGDVSGSIAVSGLVDVNVEDTYTVTYEVSDAAGNPAVETRTVNVVVTPNSYGIIALHSMHLKQKSHIQSGFVGVNGIGEKPFIAGGAQLMMGVQARTAPQVRVSTPSVSLLNKARIAGTLVYSELGRVAKNARIGTQEEVPESYWPLFGPTEAYDLPAFETGTPGTDNIDVKQKKRKTLEPGAYGNVRVRQKGTLILTGGTYELKNLHVGQHARVICQAAVTLLIQNKFHLDQHAVLRPDEESGIDASDILVYVEGVNGRNGRLRASPKAAKVGVQARCMANIYAPNGTVWLRQKSHSRGSFIGKDVIVGVQARVQVQSGWNTPGVIFDPPADVATKITLTKPVLEDEVEDAGEALVFGVDQNFPNPFNPDTAIRYVIDRPSDVRLVIYNVLGQEVRTLVDWSQNAGVHVVVWDGKDAIGRQVTSGVYLYRLAAGSNAVVKKMILAK